VISEGAKKDQGMVAEQMRLLEVRLEEVESAAAAREAEDFLGTANAFLGLLAAGLLLALVALGAERNHLAVLLALVVSSRCFFFRQLRALWLCVLILWKYKQSAWEAKRLCEEDGKRLLSARYRVLAFLGARGLRQLGGVWPKVGQYLSTQGDKWPDEMLAELRKLRDAMPAAPAHITKRTIKEDLGQPVEKLFRSFEEQPIASASIGQVHEAILHDGRLVAVKVQHRHAARQIPIDVAYMRLLANLAWLLTMGEVDLMPVVVEWLGAVLEELDFQNEAKNQSRGRSELQAAGLDIVVPEVYESLCGRRVLVMEFVEGHQVTAGDASLSAAERLEVMTSLVRAYAHGLFVSGHFNGDPHAGNLLVTRKNGKAQCVLLDWGLTKELTNQRRLAACKLIVAVGMKDTNGIVEAFREMGMNFSANADPEPELLLTILRHISLIEHKTESRRIEAKFGQTMEKAISHKMGLHSKVDSYTGDFFFIFRVASLIKGLATVLDIRAQFLEIFIEVSRGVLAGPRPRPAPSLAVQSNAEARLAREAQRALQSGAVGIQIARVSRDGSTILNLAFGHVAYTSWQPLHPTDAFPLHGTAFMATLVTASTAHALRQKGISLSAPVASLLWTKFPAPSGTTVGEVVRGAGPWSQAPAAPSARHLADLQEMLKWLETAPPASGSCPSWWPATAHATVCAALLRKVGRTPSDALQSFFSQASRPFFKATQSPIQISKPILSVESAEVEASQDALVASLGADDMRCMHLADVCLPNSAALRGSELFAGAASAASFGAGLAMSVDFWSKTMLSNSVSCAKRSASGEVAIVLLTCADAELAPRLAELALRE